MILKPKKNGIKIRISSAKKEEIRLDYPYLRVELSNNSIRVFNSFTGVTHRYKDYGDYIKLNRKGIDEILNKIGKEFEETDEVQYSNAKGGVIGILEKIQ